MKLSYFLIILGIIFLIDGIVRIIMGIISGSLVPIAGGIIGLGIGGFLLWRGILRRYEYKVK